MNILLTNYFMTSLGGSETFTYTLAKELERLGHNVEVFAFEYDDKFNLNFVYKPKSKYDLILASHNVCLKILKHTEGYKILTCHGIYPRLEQPIEGANRYVSISEEVQQYLRFKGFNSTIIHNGIDCKRFISYRKINKKLQNVLSLCKGDSANYRLAKACKNLELEFETIQSIWNVEEMINWADLVVSLGRGAYEAMSCGRSVFVYDTREYTELKTGDGIVTKENCNELLKNNFSGRRFKIPYSVKDLERELLKYDSTIGEFNRKFALENFDVRKTAKQYLKLY